MPCLLGLLALLLPRVVIVILVIATDYLGQAYDTLLWPLLGFFFMPLTTLAYAFAVNEQGTVTGWYFGLVLVAALVDLGAIGGGSNSRWWRRRLRRRRR